jgi:hypothetical protein
VDRLRDRQKPGKKMMGDMIPILSVLVQGPVETAGRAARTTLQRREAHQLRLEA